MGAGRVGHGWQLILADLALILFLLTLSALPAAEAEAGRQLAARAVQEKTARESLRPEAEIAAAHALFRPVAGGPGLGEWLEAQSRPACDADDLRDPRAGRGSRRLDPRRGARRRGPRTRRAGAHNHLYGEGSGDLRQPRL
ncbi:MAG: hypothetical protein C0472_01250 [Erythrobacter sp.]|nr:hypothetical protein [Erythrobacter sp.]